MISKERMLRLLCEYLQDKILLLLAYVVKTKSCLASGASTIKARDGGHLRIGYDWSYRVRVPLPTALFLHY